MVRDELNKMWIGQRKKDYVTFTENCKHVADVILKCKKCFYAKSNRYELGILLTPFYDYSTDEEVKINRESYKKKMDEIDYLVDILGDVFNSDCKREKSILKECAEFIDKLYIYEVFYDEEKNKKVVKGSSEYIDLINAAEKLLKRLTNNGAIDEL